MRCINILMLLSFKSITTRQRPSGDEPGAAFFMSVFFIKAGLVTISTEQDVRHPVRRFAHLLTDHIQVNIRTAFDDQLIMNVTNNEAMPECLHGIAEDVTADSLYDVLHELRTVARLRKALPIFCRSLSVVLSSHFWLCSEWLLLIGVWHWLCLPDFL